MRSWRCAWLSVALLALAGGWGVAAEPAMMRNPPPKEEPGEDCGRSPKEIDQGCVKVRLDLGRMSAPSGRRPVSLQVYTNTASEAIFTPEELKAPQPHPPPQASEAIFTPEELKVVMYYTFDHFGPERTSRTLPAWVVFIQPKGLPRRTWQ